MNGNDKDTITSEESVYLCKECLLKKQLGSSSKRKMSIPNKISSLIPEIRKLNLKVSFFKNAICVPVDRCQTCSLKRVAEKVPFKNVAEKIVSLKNGNFPIKIENGNFPIKIENENFPIKIENEILKKTYKPRRTSKYSKKNMTPEQIEDYYFARQVQVSERFHLRSRVPQPSSQLSLKSKTGVKTEAIPSDERKTRGYGVTPKLKNVIGQKEMRPVKIQREMRKNMLPVNGNLVQCSEKNAKSIFPEKCDFSLAKRITRTKQICVT